MRVLPRGLVSAVARTLSSSSKEAARALPDSKGGETPKQLQTYRTEIYSYFTRADGETHLLYSAENWVRIKLTLETAGPVVVGTSASLQPMLSGRGRPLDTTVEFEVHLPKGSRFYVISETVNRISVTIEPIPWFEQIATEQAYAAATLREAILSAASSIVSAIGGLKGAAETKSASGSGKTAATMPPCPTPVGLGRPRLTSIVTPKRLR